jgi:hypothetical protein
LLVLVLSAFTPLEKSKSTSKTKREERRTDGVSTASLG